ncbi:hypothetical protein Vretifemale_14006 [Volvox reticuliferus]|uniref:SET domain-containing protein n=1 Tax=Volvox reticuliferus TaxID=1737510 RepID=A0A8J4FR50_9CHLO|nr:hypothetical protein Vretifemale_14006 [Volvox reticuliferus]
MNGNIPDRKLPQWQGRAAAAAHTRAIQRRALRKQQREQRRQERQQEDGAPAGKGGGVRGVMLPLTVAPAETEAAVETAAKAHPAAAAPIPLGSSESSYESSSSSDDGAGAAAPRRDRRRCPLSRPGVQHTLRSVLQLQSVLAAWPCNCPLTSAGSASIGADFDEGENGCGPHGGSRRRSQPQDASGAAATETAAVRAVSTAARALATVLTNALEVALHPPFAAGLIGASRAAGAGGAVTAAGPLDFPLALYRNSCRLNHSCRPTATYHFRSRGQISVRLIADLRAGAEVTVSYIDLALPRSRRRNQLRDKYGFGCGCERCGGGDSGAPPITATADSHKPGISPTASTNPTESTALNADRLLSACGTVPVPGADESEKADGSYGDRLEGVSAGGVPAEAGGKQLARCIQRSGNGVMLAAGGADADCSIMLQPPSHASPACKKKERKDAEERAGHAAGQEGPVSAATATITATTAAAVATAATSLSLEQRLQLVVRDCGDLLLQGKPTSLSDGQLPAEPVYAALIHSLDKLLAEAQIQATAEAEAPSAPGGSAAARKPTGAAGSGGLAFHPQHAACLDAYTLLASAARRCARVATAAAATTTTGAHDYRPRSQPQLQNDTRALGGGGDRPEGKVEMVVDLSSGTDRQMEDDGARLHDVAPPELRVVGWWMRAVCASLAGVAAAERLLAADPALLQMAAASWSDAASTACEMLSALFGAAAATECRPKAVAVAVATTATSATTGSAAGVPVAGPCALLHRVWNPSPAAMAQPAQSAMDRSEQLGNGSIAGRRAGTGTASSAITENGSQPARSGGDRPGSDGDGGGDGGGAQARDGINWTRAALVEAVRVALAAERSALGECCPPKLTRQYRYAAMAGSAHPFHPPQSRYREERHQGYNQHRHRHYRHGNGNDSEHPAAENSQRPDAATDGGDSGSDGRELRLKQRLPGRGNGPIPGGSLQGRRPRLEDEEGRLRDGDVKRSGGGRGGEGAAGGSELGGHDERRRERTARSGRCEEDTSGRARVSREDCERSRWRSSERTEQELKRDDEKWTKTRSIRDSGPESEVDRRRDDTWSDRNRDPDRNQDSIALSWDPDHDRARCDEHFLDYREGCEGVRTEQHRKSQCGREFSTEGGRDRDYAYGGGGEGRRRALYEYKCAQRPGSACELERAREGERERDSCGNRGLTSDWPPKNGPNQWQHYGRSTEDRSRHPWRDRDHRAPPRERPGGGSGRELAAQQWEGGASPSRHKGQLRSRSGDGGGDFRPREHDRGSSGGGNDARSQRLSSPPRQADRAAAAAAADDCCLGGALRIRSRPSSRSPARSRSRSRCRCARSPSRDGSPWAPQGSLGVQQRHQQQRRLDGAVQELERQIAKLGHSPRRRQRPSEEDVNGSGGNDGGNAKRRRIAESEPIPQPAAAFAASATAGAANPGGVKEVGSSVPMAAAEDTLPGGIHWRHYTAPKATAAACAALFRECHRLDEQIHDGLGSVRRRRLPVAPAVAVAAINDWLGICASTSIKKLPPSPLDDAVAGASRVLVTPWRLATSCNAVGVAEPVKYMGGDSSAAAVVVAVEATAGVAAVAAGHCLARVQLLLRLLLGETHGACEAAHFLPFFVRHLPYEVASELTQLAYTLLSREHMPHVPMN